MNLFYFFSVCQVQKVMLITFLFLAPNQKSDLNHFYFFSVCQGAYVIWITFLFLAAPLSPPLLPSNLKLETWNFDHFFRWLFSITFFNHFLQSLFWITFSDHLFRSLFSITFFDHSAHHVAKVIWITFLSWRQAVKSDLHHFYSFSVCRVAKVVSITFLFCAQSRKKWFESLLFLLCVPSRKSDFNHFFCSVRQAEKSDLNHFFLLFVPSRKSYFNHFFVLCANQKSDLNHFYFFSVCQVTKVISITFLFCAPSRKKWFESLFSFSAHHVAKVIWITFLLLAPSRKKVICITFISSLCAKAQQKWFESLFCSVRQAEKRWFESLFFLLYVPSRKSDFKHCFALCSKPKRVISITFFSFSVCQGAKVISITFLLSAPSKKVISIIFPLAGCVCGSLAESLGKKGSKKVFEKSDRRKWSKKIIEKWFLPPPETWNLITFFDHFFRSLFSITFFLSDSADEPHTHSKRKKSDWNHICALAHKEEKKVIQITFLRFGAKNKKVIQISFAPSHTEKEKKVIEITFFGLEQWLNSLLRLGTYRRKKVTQITFFGLAQRTKKWLKSLFPVSKRGEPKSDSKKWFKFQTWAPRSSSALIAKVISITFLFFAPSRRKWFKSLFSLLCVPRRICDFNHVFCSWRLPSLLLPSPSNLKLETWNFDHFFRWLLSITFFRPLFSNTFFRTRFSITFFDDFFRSLFSITFFSFSVCQVAKVISITFLFCAPSRKKWFESLFFSSLCAKSQKWF